MSRSSGRRNLNLIALSNFNKPLPQSNLMFQWSISAAHSPLLEDNSSVILPPIDTTRSQRKVSTDSSSLIRVSSPSHSSISTQNFLHLPCINKKSHSPVSTEHEQSSTRSSPLLLSYNQLHRGSSSSPVKQPTQTNLSPHSISDKKRNSVSLHPISDNTHNSVSIHPTSDTERNNVSIHPISNKKRNNISSVNNKLNSISKTTMSSKTTAPLLSTISEQRKLNNNLVRLNTSQLRRLNVSEKYINEAKKLYFNIPCRSFVPRVAIV
ncbi:unnamed protein product [Rotaria sordida]|uniref:Uncharacterized protein n=1 Tax=Rotaria sordida TaxID=392033 RepID=A0A818ZAW5_9BILA|nr:unnamed protein product [Rotaria sordida]CAF0913472.1 unnamed protein product [Rotaria sordida]CAF3733654.1 unnamed protein product [Rotaria sordida]CAF3768782.1 unnamed protein product [Rotaria sordida]